MKNSIVKLVFVVVLSACVAAIRIDSDLHSSSKEALRLMSKFENIVTYRSARGWQFSALEKSKQKLRRLESEMDQIQRAHQCQKKKERLLRTLYWKQKNSKCGTASWRARRDCNKKWGLLKQLRRGKKLCNWNKNCLAKNVWPVQWMLKKAEEACKCASMVNIKREIWEAKGIKCPKTKKGWIVKSEIHKIQKKIEYFENVLRPKPSVSPRH